MVRLDEKSLTEIPARVPVPGYDRSQLRAGIVHIGVGGFHRAHQAMYLDQLFNAGLGHDWGITGVGLLPGDRRMQEVMSRQDCLYTLVTRDAADNTTVNRTASHLLGANIRAAATTSRRSITSHRAVSRAPGATASTRAASR